MKEYFKPYLEITERYNTKGKICTSVSFANDQFTDGDDYGEDIFDDPQ